MNVRGGGGGGGGLVAESLVGLPAPQLRRLVGCYRAARFDGLEPGVHRGLPSRNLEFIFCLGMPLRVASTPASAEPAAYSALVAGLHQRPAVIAHGTSMRNVSLELTPAGARALFGVPAGELTGQVVDLSDLLGRSAFALTERLAAAPDWAACFGVLDDVLTRWAGSNDVPDDCAGYVWRRILETNGTARIGDLAAEVGYGRRHVGTRFTREFGLSPKQAARIVRFEHSRELVRHLGRTASRRPRLSLADIAARCGYYDQAHLTREWTELAGCAPSVWMASEQLSFLQDTAPDPAPGS